MPIKKFKAGKQDILGILKDLEGLGKEHIARELSELIFGTDIAVKRTTNFGIVRIMKQPQNQEDYDEHESKGRRISFSERDRCPK